MKIKSLAFSLALMLLTAGCALKHADSTPATPYEKVTVYNATLAQINNSIARGVISLSSTNPPVLSTAATEKILRIQGAIAADDNRLTVILDQGPNVAKGQAVEIQSLIAVIIQEIDSGVQDSSFAVKNPASQQTFSQDLGAVKLLADQITQTLKTAGVLQ